MEMEIKSSVGIWPGICGIIACVVSYKPIFDGFINHANTNGDYIFYSIALVGMIGATLVSLGCIDRYVINAEGVTRYWFYHKKTWQWSNVAVIIIRKRRFSPYVNAEIESVMFCTDYNVGIAGMNKAIRSIKEFAYIMDIDFEGLESHINKEDFWAFVKYKNWQINDIGKAILIFPSKIQCN